MSNGTHERTRWRHAALTLTGLAALVTAGCDQTPTDSLPTDATVAAESVQEVWSMLPTTVEMESEALQQLQTSPGSESSVALLIDAGELASEADAAATLGASSDVAMLEEAADTMATDGLLSAFGPNEADAVIADVEAALASLEAGLGASVDGDVRARLAEAAEALRNARQARARGFHARALRHALRASESLRWLNPERKANAAVTAATALLERATELAGEDVDPAIERALDAAGAFCTSARVALEAERWRLAIADARACARISRAVIVRLAAGIDQAVLAERAEEAIAHAGAVFERVTEEAGPTPEPRVEELLGEAGALLDRAKVAFDEESYRKAIGLAAHSTAHSLRALRLLRDDIPDPFELRATAAVEVAAALSARVADRMDENTPSELVEAAERADALLAEAQAAFGEQLWREAWKLARQAIVIYVRLLVALA